MKITSDTISNWRKGADDSAVASMAAENDPEFKSMMDFYSQNAGRVDPFTRSKLPTLLLNKHYQGSWTDAPPDDVTATVGQQVAKKADQKKGFLERAAGYFADRSQAAFGSNTGIIESAMNPSETLSKPSALQRFATGQQGITETGLQVAGQAAGLANDFIGEGIGLAGKALSAVTPDSIEKPITDAISGTANDVAESPAGQAVGDMASAYEQWRQANPGPASTLEGSVNILSLLPFGGAVKKGKAVISEAAGSIGLDDLAMGADDIALVRKTAQAERLVQPKVTEKLIKDVGSKNPDLLKEGLLKTTLKPSEYEKELAQTALKSVPEFAATKNPVKTAKKVQDSIERSSEALRSTFKANDAVLPQHEISSAVSKRVAEAADDFGDQPGVFESTRRVWDKISAKHPGTLSGQWQARIDFYREVENRFGGSIFDKGSARAQAVRAVGQAANESIDQAAKSAGMSFKDQIDEISRLFDIKENLSTKFSASGPVKKALRTPAGRIGVSAAAGAAGLGAYQSIAH